MRVRLALDLLLVLLTASAATASDTIAWEELYALRLVLDALDAAHRQLQIPQSQKIARGQLCHRHCVPS